MQLPEHSGHRWLVAAQLMVGLSLVFSSTLFATGLYQVAVGALRSAGQPNGVDLALRLLHVIAGAAGLAAFSSLLRRCQACKLWLGLALSMASLVACAFLALRMLARDSVGDATSPPVAFGADHVALIVAVSASLALCLVQSAALYLLQTARGAAARRPRRYQGPPATPPPPLTTIAASLATRRWPQLQQHQRMAELWRRFDGPQHLPPPMTLAGAPPPPPPPPPYPELPAKPPPYTQSRV